MSMNVVERVETTLCYGDREILQVTHNGYCVVVCDFEEESTMPDALDVYADIFRKAAQLTRERRMQG